MRPKSRHPLRIVGGLQLFLAGAIFLAFPTDGFSSPKTPEEARKHLAQLGLQYNADSFLSSVDQNDKMAVDLYLAAGLDINTQNADGFTALIVATSKGNTNLVNTLLSKGANVNLKTKLGVTALLGATTLNHPGIALALIEKGAEVSVSDPDGGTPLEHATRHHQVAVVTNLLARGGELDAQGTHQRTALFVAAENGFQDLVKLFVEEKAKLELKDDAGITALMISAMKGHSGVTKFLIDNHANVNTRDGEGDTVLDVALFGDHPETVDMLFAAGAKPDRYVRKRIDEASTEVKNSASVAFGSVGGSLDRTRELALRELSKLKTDRFVDEECVRLARNNFVESLKNALYLYQLRGTSAKTDRDREIEQKFAALMEELLPGSAAAVTAKADSEAVVSTQKVADPTLVATIWLTGTTPFKLISQDFAEYDKAVLEAIRQRWSDLVEANNLETGAPPKQVEVKCILSAEGRIKNLPQPKTENGVSLCLAAVRDPSPYASWPRLMRNRIGAPERSLKLIFVYGPSP